MAKIKEHGLSWQNKILRIVLPSVMLLNPRPVGGQTLGVWRWRPISSIDIVAEPNEARAKDFIGRLVYTEADAKYLFDITISLPPEEATGFLKKYIKEYSNVSDLTSISWARAVFCLGLTQTDESKNELLRLWDVYDKRLAKGRMKVTPKTINTTFSPLLVIGDALHFYLWDNQIRQWFLKKIEEAEGLRQYNGLDNIAKASRRSDREMLLYILYLWDIIESVDDEPVITSSKLIDSYPFHQRQTVKNISKSAERVVDWVNKMHTINPAITEKEWLQIRKSHQEYRLDTVCRYLRIPLAMTLWKEYLREDSSDTSKLNKHRLWLLTIWTYLGSFTYLGSPSWVPQTDDTSLLHDACSYVSDLPDGHIRNLAMQSLLGIACYSPYPPKNEVIQQIRMLSEKLLTENVRASVVASVERNMATMKKSKSRLTEP